MAKKKKRKARKPTIPVAVVAGFTAGLIAPATHVVAGRYGHAYRDLVANYTGLEGAGTANPVWKPQVYLMRGLVPLLIGMGVHKLASMLGINRALGQSGIPYIRI